MRLTTRLLFCALMLHAAFGSVATNVAWAGGTPVPLSINGFGELQFPAGMSFQLAPVVSPGQVSLVPPHVRAPLSADAAAVVNGNNQFAWNIYKHLSADAKPTDNVLVSPFSISAALAMTYAGARGQTAQQMADVLGFALPDDRLHPAFGEFLRDLTVDRDGYQLDIANRLFGQTGYAFKKPFLDITGVDYNAPLESVNFGPDETRKHINQWVADNTNQKIHDLLPAGSIDESTRLVLTNATYFNGSWKYKFDKSSTTDEPFHGASGGQSPVSMMRQQQYFGYAERPGYQMLERPYAGDDLSMVLMLPTDRDGLNKLEATLSPGEWNTALSALHETEVNVSLPKFSFDSSFGLGPALTSLGMTNAFDERLADFSGIADATNENLYIGDVLHKAFINVNEEGTEAAAATAVIVGATDACYDCAPPSPKIFDADHPFLFALRDVHSGSLLFVGRVVDPGSLTDTSSSLTPEPTSAAILGIATIFAAWNRRLHVRVRHAV